MFFGGGGGHTMGLCRYLQTSTKLTIQSSEMFCIIFSLSLEVKLTDACLNKTYSNVNMGAHLLKLYEPLII